MTIAYIYTWIHVPTMKWYIGSRTAKNCHPADGYICSSKVVKPMILKNALEWKREILATGSVKEMKLLEAKILNCLNAKDNPDSFNKHNADGLFNSEGHNLGRKTVHKNGMYKRIKPEYVNDFLNSGWILGTPEIVKNKISLSTVGKSKPGHSKGGPKKGSIPWNKGRKETRLEVLEKQSLSHIGKKYSKQQIRRVKQC